MGTQFSKIKVTQRVELHGEVFDHADGDYDTGELPDLFTRRAHHSGVISGHELLSYSFLGGAACEPRRSLRRKHRSKSLYSSFRSTNSSRYILSNSTEKDLAPASAKTTLDMFDHELGDLCCKDRSPDSELDSGISVNVNYENHDPRWNNKLRKELNGLNNKDMSEESSEQGTETEKIILYKIFYSSACVFFSGNLYDVHPSSLLR